MFGQSCAKKNIVSTKRYHRKSCHSQRKNGFVRGATATLVLLIFWTLCLFQPVFIKQTLPKALRTQALTALTSNSGRFGRIGLAW